MKHQPERPVFHAERPWFLSVAYSFEPNLSGGGIEEMSAAEGIELMKSVGLWPLGVFGLMAARWLYLAHVRLLSGSSFGE